MTGKEIQGKFKYWVYDRASDSNWLEKVTKENWDCVRDGKGSR